MFLKIMRDTEVDRDATLLLMKTKDHLRYGERNQLNERGKNENIIKRLKYLDILKETKILLYYL